MKQLLYFDDLERDYRQTETEMQQQQVVATAENNGRMEVDELAIQPNKKDVDEQMQTLMNEPFVQRIKDFFSLTLEKFKHDQ